MIQASDYWDALAPHHSTTENNFLDLPSVRRIIQDIQAPVLVVGAGQGLIVAELLKNGIKCDGIDLSFEMIRYAKKRRGLTSVQADARAMPFGAETYQTIIYATGVVDFIRDEKAIKAIMNDARRVINNSGKIFVAFYRFSSATEDFLTRLGLLNDNLLSFRESLEIYALGPFQAIAWVASKAKINYVCALILSLRSFVLTTTRERSNAFTMQKIFRQKDRAAAFINSAPESLPYRNGYEIRDLFKRLDIPIKRLTESRSCFIVEI